MPKYKVSWRTKYGVEPFSAGIVEIEAPDIRRAPGWALDEVSAQEGIPIHLLRHRSVSTVVETKP